MTLAATGVLIVLSELAHGLLGWPAIRQALIASNTETDLIEGVGIDWLFASASMLTFGILTLMVWRAGGRGNVSAARVMAPISALYILFGAAALARSGFEPHFLGFALIGLPAGVAAYAVTRPA